MARIMAILIALSLLVGTVGCRTSDNLLRRPEERLRLATTTSLYDTGIWDYLEPIFEQRYGAKLDILYAGTGIALEYGRRGDVDALAVHDKGRELEFVFGGHGIERVPFAYNYFLIVGPKNDPAGIAGMSPEDAFKKLAESGLGLFISRGDDSGTHSKEKTIWQSAGYDYETIRQASDWYIESGQGMGPTLLMASEKQAYTLSDTGTFLSYKGRANLIPIVDKGGLLLNVYSVIVVDPEKHPKVNHEMASNLVNFLTSPEIQKLIGGYGNKEYGSSLFIPCAGNEPTS